jgi:hypothetical protein
MLVRFTVSRPWRSIGAVLLWLLPAACSLVVGELPEPLPGGPSAGVGGDTPSAGQAAGGSMAHAGMPPVGEAGDSASGGRSEGGSVSGGSGGSAASCDADQDEHLAEGKCGGDDCDDADANVSPAQVDYFDERHERVDYDYDCSGAAEQEQAAPIVCSGVSVGTCPTATGFLKALPPCGEPGDWGTCVKTPPLATCDPMVIDSGRRMRCR